MHFSESSSPDGSPDLRRAEWEELVLPAAGSWVTYFLGSPRTRKRVVEQDVLVLDRRLLELEYVTVEHPAGLAPDAWEEIAAFPRIVHRLVLETPLRPGTVDPDETELDTVEDTTDRRDESYGHLSWSRRGQLAFQVANARQTCDVLLRGYSTDSVPERWTRTPVPDPFPRITSPRV